MTAHASPLTPARGRATAWLAASRDELVDAAFLIALVVLGLIGFKSTYGDDGYMVGGVFGLLVGVVIAHLAWRLSLPGIAAAATTVIAFFALGGAAAAHSTAIGGVIPTGSTLRSLASGSIHGWVELLTLLPPIGSSGPLLVIPYLLGLSAGVAGYLLACRSRSPLLPAIVPTAVLVTSILFGTLEPVSTLLQGGLFAIVALGWGATRQDRRVIATLGSSRRLRRIVSAAAVLAASGGAAVVVGPHLPFAHSHSRVVMRDYVAPPFDASAYPSPLGSFRNYVNKNALRDKTLFTVHGLPPGDRIRLATMDVYDGLVWGVSNGAAGTAGAFQRVGTSIPSTQPGRHATVEITIKDYSDVWVPDAGSTDSVRFSGADGPALDSDYRYDLATGTAIEPDGLRKDDSYTLQVTIPSRPSAGTLAAASAAGEPADVSDAPPIVDAKATQWAGHGSGAYAALRSIATHLRAGSYSDGGANGSTSLPGHSYARLEVFLTQPQLVGDDEQYAATFALLANALGYPTRVVLGAVPEKDGVVKGSDVHAWDEVDLTGAGWVPFYPTPPTSHHPNPIPPQVLTVDHTPSLVPPPIQESQPAPQLNTNSTASSSSKKAPHHSKPAVAAAFGVVFTVVRVAGPPIALILVVVCSILCLKLERRRRRRNRGTPAQKVSAGWRELVDLVIDLGAPRPAPGTRRMVARALGRSDLSSMAGAADAVNFGPSDPDEAAANQYWRQVDEARQRLLGQVGRRRRLAARLSLASLKGPRLRRRPPAAPDSDGLIA